MHQSGKGCVLFIKIWHSINLSGREDTGGFVAQLSGLSLQTVEQSIWIFHSIPLPNKFNPSAVLNPTSSTVTTTENSFVKAFAFSLVFTQGSAFRLIMAQILKTHPNDTCQFSVCRFQTIYPMGIQWRCQGYCCIYDLRIKVIGYNIGNVKRI